MAPIVVSELAVSAVKGTRLLSRSELVLGLDGVRENRRFYVIDERGRMLNGKQLGELTAIVADYDDDARRLALRFPDGRVVDGDVELGAAVQTSFFSTEIAAQLLHGPFSQALSDLAGRPLRLVEAPDAGGAVDRGRRGAVSLVSCAALAQRAGVAGVQRGDSRRFRMLVVIDGTGAHAEDEWVGGRARIGGALVAFHGHVGRCLVTGRDPEDGRPNLPTLELLASYRAALTSTEPLPFGVWGEVLEAGRISIGDAVTPG